ncbi:MAG: hypothetical protein ACK559_04525, partial [bacterium]
EVTVRTHRVETGGACGHATGRARQECLGRDTDGLQLRLRHQSPRRVRIDDRATPVHRDLHATGRSLIRCDRHAVQTALTGAIDVPDRHGGHATGRFVARLQPRDRNAERH